jgi:DNA mismatch repair ATPase MutS
VELPATIGFVFSRRKEGLRELIQHQSKESERRHEESERRHEEFLQREEKRKREFDRYMEKRDEESKEREARLQLLTAETRVLTEKAEAREEETREFNREILLRNEKVYTSLIAQVEENTEQIRANTRAVLSALDRFNGPGEAAA